MCGVTVDPRNELDHLLARGRLSGPRRDRIFDEVDKQVRGSWRSRSRYLLIGGPLALAAALALAIRPGAGPHDGLAAKGGAHSNVDIGCSGGELSHCPRGSKLIFQFDSLRNPVFLHAWAEPLAPGLERVWYYPTAAHAPPRVAAFDAAQTLEQGVVVGAEHAPGAYRVHLVLASAPLSRDELLLPVAPNVVAAETVDMVVVDP